jgi:hypothetical protein
MWPFNKKIKQEKPRIPLSIEEVTVKTPVEIVAHKNATKEQVEEVKRANENLQKVFERNHFTVKLYVAAGGKAPARK